MTRSIDDFIGIGPYRAGEIPEALVHTFKDNDGNPIWLGDAASSTFQFRRLGDAETRGGACEILEQGDEGDVGTATRGQVRYEWAEGDIDDTPGMYAGNIWSVSELERIASDELRWAAQRVT